MPPVKTVASTTDVDNEATAELPVLDVAAYEATLNDSIASTDTWNLPAVPDATAQMPALAESIPTLRPADDLADLSGTHEMPAFSRPNKVVRATQVPTPTVTVHTAPPSPIIEELRAALAAAERRIVELNEWARIADAERSVAVARAAAENAQLREQLSHHLETLSTARARRDVKRADEPGLEDELFMRADRIVTLDKELALRAAELASVRAMLAATQARESRLESDVSNLRTALERRDQQIAALTADLSARQERETQLAERLEHAVAASNPDVPALRAEIADREEQIQSLKAELGRARTAAAERNADLEVAEESIRNLEIEVRDKSGKLDEATHTVEEWRAVIAESQKSILQRDTRIQQLQADLDKKLSSTLDTAAQTGEEVALEGPARVLIRTDGNTDFVHVLGRRTRIGRGSDNELVLDTKHVSRYHAVLLAGPVHTSIEDLNSTNGVFVNGKRVARHVLKDGDRVTIGKTHYRFSVRS